MDEPREVTGVRGQSRWVAKDGRSYASLEDARTANRAYDEGTEPPPPVPAEQSRFKDLLTDIALASVFGYLTYFAARSAFAGTLKFDNEWMYVILPIGWFLLAGLALQSAAAVWATVTGREAEAARNQAWELWVHKLGCGILLLIGGVLGFLLMSEVFSEAFEGVSKGTGIIIVLLFAILVVLMSKSEKR